MIRPLFKTEIIQEVFPKPQVLFLGKQFLVFSRRCSSEKSATITVAGFFRQITDLIVYVPLFTDFTRSRVLVSTVFTRFTVNPADTGSSPCFSQDFFEQFFLALCDFFSIFCLQRVPPSSFFLIFFSKLKCQKALRISFFMFFGTMRRKFKKTRTFSCLQRSPFKVFDILQQTGF